MEKPSNVRDGALVVRQGVVEVLDPRLDLVGGVLQAN